MSNKEDAEFWPKNTENTKYIESEYAPITLNEMINKCAELFPDTDFDSLTITTECIHTHCLGYDLYDSSDYTNFLVIEKL